MKKIIDFIDKIIEWTGRTGCVLIALLNFIVVFEVVLRYFFKSPTIFNFELTIMIYAFHFMITDQRQL